jgi:ABC-type sugar transport system ATPase subunit
MTTPSDEAGMAVRVHDVTRSFGGKLALDGVSLDVPVGSVVGLVRENGAGKTTLIKHGAEQPVPRRLPEFRATRAPP